MITINKERLKSKRFHHLNPIIDAGILGDGVFLAGGAIRSILTDELVADFDIFFESGELVEEVRNRLARLGYQLIFECPEGKLYTYVLNDEYGGDPIKVQLILETIGAPRAVINLFDFTACCASFDGEDFLFHPNFFRHVLKKELHLHHLSFPVATIKRTSKYRDKGYDINLCLRQIINTIQVVALNGEAWSDEDLRAYID